MLEDEGSTINGDFDTGSNQMQTLAIDNMVDALVMDPLDPQTHRVLDEIVASLKPEVQELYRKRLHAQIVQLKLDENHDSSAANANIEAQLLYRAIGEVMASMNEHMDSLNAAAALTMRSGIDAVRAETHRGAIGFIDIVGSSRIKLSCETESWSDGISRYFDCLADICRKNRVEVFKYVGDMACLTSEKPEDMLQALLILQTSLQERPIEFSMRGSARRSRQLAARAGMNYGKFVTQEIGSREFRDTTPLGPVPDLAARVLDLADRKGAKILLTGTSVSTIRQNAGRDFDAVLRSVEYCKLPGFLSDDVSPIPVYSAGDPQLTNEQYRGEFKRLLLSYLAGEWRECYDELKTMGNAGDRAAADIQLFMRRKRTKAEDALNILARNGGLEWPGLFEMREDTMKVTQGSQKGLRAIGVTPSSKLWVAPGTWHVPASNTPCDQGYRIFPTKAHVMSDDYEARAPKEGFNVLGFREF